MKVIEDNIEYDVNTDTDGVSYWYVNNFFHRINGPAIERIDGYKAWWNHGKRHREDGPAIEYLDDRKEYYLNGKRYYDITSDEEWIKLVPIISIIE
jgi:hypothetical protein